MRNKEIISRNYKNQCSLGHEHNISVKYDINEGIFTISKEMPVTEEDVAEEEKDIAQILKEKTCFFCKKGVKREELAGFDHEGYNPIDISKTPICQKCWKENQKIIEHKEEYFSSLEDYWISTGIKGNEELENCPVLTGYPKKEKIIDWGKNEFLTPKDFSKFDLEQIFKFGQEIDIQGFLKRRQTYGKINDDQKLLVLEHLCWLRDQELRGSEEYNQFQVIIERIREIYRKQNE